MKFDDRREMFILSSRREFYACCGTLGLSDDLVLKGGFDDRIDDDDVFLPWDKEERAEIADYMIDLWTKWKNKS